MNTRQIAALALGGVLLVLNFVFPYSSYPTKESSEDGRTFRVTTRLGFVPIWKVWEGQEKAVLKGNLFDDTIIQWPAVLVMAAGIVGVSGWCVYRLGRGWKKPSPPELS